MLPQQFPNRLVILGGGTAGWMCAAHLDRTYNLPDRKRLQITLVESPAIGRIGVGEATIPTLLHFCEFIGIEETLLMQRTNATFKHGVLFEDWNGPGTRYFHAFEALGRNTSHNAGPAWLARKARGTALAFDEEIGIQRRVADAGRAPKHLMQPGYGGPLPYAYHLDAEAFGDLLCEIAVARGVEHVTGEVVAVDQTAEGDVTALTLRDGRMIEGDFFVDCSGFAQLLIGKTLETPFISFARDLLCDRAIALQIPHAADTPIPPYTRAIAQSAGWQWRIGLQTRQGTGSLYSSAFLDDDAAETELRQSVGADDAIPVRKLKMAVGHPESPWNRNVVAIGLAGGFVEPLESTSIHMIEIALELLVRHFPLSGMNPAARDRFNLILNQRYRELRDFIALHYCLTKRRDTPFWRAVASEDHVPDSLRAKLELWRDRHPATSDFDGQQTVFSHHSWQSVLYGMDAADPVAMANADRWLGDVDGLVAMIDSAAEKAIADLPSHMFWLAGLRTLNVNHSGW